MHSARSPMSIPKDYTSVGISQIVVKIFTRNVTITDVYTDGYSPSAFYRELQKYLLEMPQSPTTLQTDTVRWHFTESCKNIYWKCHNHRWLYRRIQSVGICRQFKVTDKITDRRCEFQREGINASLIVCSCRRTAKNIEGN